MFIETLHFDFDENIAGVSLIETEDIYLDIQADCILFKIICIRYPLCPLLPWKKESIHPQFTFHLHFSSSPF